MLRVVRFGAASAILLLALGEGARAQGPGTGIRKQVWIDIGAGEEVSDLITAPGYPDSPTTDEIVAQFDGEVDWAENYGTRFRGYVYPPETGEYTFWICSDDASRLLLSTDEDPANAVEIASVATWTDYDEWDKVEETNQQSDPITLDSANRYYIEALQKEGGGGDHIKVKWKPPTLAEESPIPGHRLDPYYANPSDVQIYNFWADPIVVEPGGSSTLSWDTANATGLTLDGSSVAMPSGTQVESPAATTTYTLEAAGPGGPKTRQATVTVIDPNHIKINCGQNYTVLQTDWVDDNAYVTNSGDYRHGGTYDTSGVTDPAPQVIYETCCGRSTDPTFDMAFVADGYYTVRLHFYDYSTTDACAFNVTIEGQTVLQDYSIRQAAGDRNKAVIEEKFAQVSDGNGMQIAFARGTGTYAYISGIEIVATAAPEATTVTVTPDPAYCLPGPGETVDLTAEVIDQYGNPFTGDVTWTVSGGGTVTPGPAPTTTFESDGTIDSFIVTAECGGVPGTATVEVGNPFLADVNVTPATATIVTTDDLVITAEPVDQKGDPIPATVTWSVDKSGGTFEPPSGTTDATNTSTTTTFTPAGVPDTFTVTATADDGMNPPVQKNMTVEVLDPVTLRIKINCGLNTYTPADWEDDDAYVSGGNDFDGWPTPGGVDPTGVPNAAPYDVYQTVRHRAAQGETHTYTIPVPNGDYIVRLHLGDGYSTAGVPAFRDVKYEIEGVLVEDHLDYSTAAGAPYKALVRDYLVTITDGDVVIDCTPYENYDVFEAGIEIIYNAPPELVSIDVTPATAYCLPGGSVELTASTLDQYGNDFPAVITWSVPSGGEMVPDTGTSSIFTSDGTAGTYTVTATSGGVEGTATVEVADPVLTTLTVTPEVAVIPLTGGDQEFTAETLDQFGDPITATVNWTVDGDGSMSPATGQKSTFTPGSTEYTFTVTATAGSLTDNATLVVTDTEAPAAITFMPQAAIIDKSVTQTYAVEVRNQFGLKMAADVSFSVSPLAGTFDPDSGMTDATTGSLATVFDPSGTYMGDCTVKVSVPVPSTTVTLEATSALTITGPQELSGVEVTPGLETIPTDGTLQLTARGLDQFGQPVTANFTWSITSSPAGGTLSTTTVSTTTFTSDGTEGTFVVAVVADDGTNSFQALAVVKVEAPVLSQVGVTPAAPPAIPAEAGETLDFTGEPQDQFGQPFTATVTWAWTVSGGGSLSPTDEAYTTFTSDGTEGTFTLIAEANDGTNTYQGTAEIIAETRALDRVTLTPNRPEIDVNGSVTFTVEALDQFGDPFPVTVDWTVSGGGSLSSSTGLTTTFSSDGSDGDFTVTATVDGDPKTARVTVLATLTGLAIGEGCAPVSAGAGWGAFLLAAALFGLVRRLRKARAHGRRQGSY